MPTSNWVEIMIMHMIPGTFSIYRTRYASKEPGRRGGYGVFGQLKGRHDRRGYKVPTQIITFLTAKLREQAHGKRENETYNLEQDSYIIENDGDTSYTFTIKPSVGPSKSFPMTHVDLKQLLMGLEAVAYLGAKQPTRVSKPEDYSNFLEEIVGWATAKRAYEACRQKGGLTPNVEIRDEAQFKELWRRVVADDIAEFEEELAKFGLSLKMQIPLLAPNLTYYRPEYVDKGFLFTKPRVLWELPQLIVDMVHETCYEGAGFYRALI